MKAWKTNLLLISVLMLVVNFNTVVAQEQPDPVAVRGEFAQAIDTQDAAKIESVFAEDGVFDYAVMGVPLMESNVAAAAFFADLFNGSPDTHTTDARVLSSGNTVIVEHNVLGTNTGVSSIPTTGNPWSLPHIDIFEIEGDKIKRLTTYADYFTIMMQLGFAPVPEPVEFVPSIVLPASEPTGLTPLEANAEHIRRWNSHDAASVAQMYREDITIFPGPLGMDLDRAAMTAMNEMYFSAFPDVAMDVVRALDLGDGWIMTELVACATHQNTFMGIPAQGYPTEIRVVWLMRHDADGLVVEGSFYYDNLTLMTQMTEPPYSPVGTWIVSVPTPERNIILLHSIHPQDAAGNTAGSTMIQVNANPTVFGLLPDVEAETPWVGQTVRIDRNTFETSFITYGTKQADGILPEIATMIMCNANWTITGPTTNVGRSTLSVYLADQDANGDGLPDPDQEPTICLGFTFTSNRLPSVPACVVPPMPEPEQ